MLVSGVWWLKAKLKSGVPVCGRLLRTPTHAWPVGESRLLLSAPLVRVSERPASRGRSVRGAGDFLLGERRGCVGTHELLGRAVTRSYSKAAMASRSRRAISVNPSRSWIACAVRVEGVHGPAVGGAPDEDAAFRVPVGEVGVEVDATAVGEGRSAARVGRQTVDLHDLVDADIGEMHALLPGIRRAQSVDSRRGPSADMGSGGRPRHGNRGRPCPGRGSWTCCGPWT